MTILGSIFPLAGWLLYAIAVNRIERYRPSLSAIMNSQRRRWVANAVTRDTPLDAILASNLMSSISFFASTTVLLILTSFAVFGQFDTVLTGLNSVRPGAELTNIDLEIYLVAMIVMLVLAFLSFTLSLRQFNHFCIMLGAADHSSHGNEREITAIAALNSLGARNFNQGIRAYYFASAGLGWFWSPYASMLATLVIAGVLMHREFYSKARALVADLHQPDKSWAGK